LASRRKASGSRAEQTLRKVERLKAVTQRIADSDGLGGEIGSTVPVADAAEASASSASSGEDGSGEG
jgi:hypothetical protein